MHLVYSTEQAPYYSLGTLARAGEDYSSRTRIDHYLVRDSGACFEPPKQKSSPATTKRQTRKRCGAVLMVRDAIHVIVCSENTVRLATLRHAGDSTPCLELIVTSRRRAPLEIRNEYKRVSERRQLFRPDHLAVLAVRRSGRCYTVLSYGVSLHVMKHGRHSKWAAVRVRSVGLCCTPTPNLWRNNCLAEILVMVISDVYVSGRNTAFRQKSWVLGSSESEQVPIVLIFVVVVSKKKRNEEKKKKTNEKSFMLSHNI